MKRISPSATKAIAQLGDDLKTARLRRRWSQKDMARLMGVSISTVQHMEKGEPGVSIGTIAMAFLCLNVLEKLSDLLQPSTDELAMIMDRMHLPKRVRSASVKTQSTSKPDDQTGPMTF